MEATHGVGSIIGGRFGRFARGGPSIGTSIRNVLGKNQGMYGSYVASAMFVLTWLTM